MKSALVVALVLSFAHPVIAAEKRHPQKQEQKQKAAEEPSFLSRMKAAFLEGWHMRTPKNSPRHGESGYRRWTIWSVPGSRATLECDHCGQTRR